MAHKRGKAEKRQAEMEERFKLDAMRLARWSLEKSIEWINGSDAVWALVHAKRAVAMLEAARTV